MINYVEQDLQLAIEIYIEAVFDIVHKGAHYLLSPAEACRVLFGWVSSCRRDNKNISVTDSNTSVPTATLGDVDPTPRERQTTFNQYLNTDARTCQDVITELG